MPAAVQASDARANALIPKRYYSVTIIVLENINRAHYSHRYSNAARERHKPKRAGMRRPKAGGHGRRPQERRHS
ncbi:hypothetical protein PUN4_560115 [Paraburkholderia unamae]|nr:hypothetical protein PUN4_560115 [Paraburkholderia unamae]